MRYCTQYNNYNDKTSVRFPFTNDTPYLALTGELSGVLCALCEWNSPRYIESPLYMASQRLTLVIFHKAVDASSRSLTLRSRNPQCGVNTRRDELLCDYIYYIFALDMISLLHVVKTHSHLRQRFSYYAQSTSVIQDSRFKIQTSFIPWKYKYSYLQ